jgi:hypothetical protein
LAQIPYINYSDYGEHPVGPGKWWCYGVKGKENDGINADQFKFFNYPGSVGLMSHATEIPSPLLTKILVKGYW